MARRRKSPAKIDLQAVLRFIADADDGVEYTPLITWIMATFGCHERAAKDNISILGRGGWVAALAIPDDRRRKRYIVTDKAAPTCVDTSARAHSGAGGGGTQPA
jgi:hypothetical protein